MTKWVHRNLFPCLFGRSCLIPNIGYIAESATSLLDRLLELNLVPYTDIVEFQSESFFSPISERIRNAFSGNICCPRKIGSFQLFLQGFVGADTFFKKYPLPGYQCSNIMKISSGHKIWSDEHVFKKFKVQVEKLIILDFIIRNTDRGLDNWMLKLESNSEEPVHKLRGLHLSDKIDSKTCLSNLLHGLNIIHNNTVGALDLHFQQTVWKRI